MFYIDIHLQGSVVEKQRKALGRKKDALETLYLLVHSHVAAKARSLAG